MSTLRSEKGGGVPWTAVMTAVTAAAKVVAEPGVCCPERSQLGAAPSTVPGPVLGRSRRKEGLTVPKPVVLFACIHNSGRSVAARLLLEHYAAGAVEARSAGSEPKDAVNPVVSEVLAERGLTTDAEGPTRLDADIVKEADVVITMGCGETCPFVPGKRYEDWVVDDPAGADLDTVRRIVDDIDTRVRRLLDGLP